MAHVFIVNEETIKVHLEYLFAGTGAMDFKCDFLLNDEEIKHNDEKRLCGMIADISKIRKGDKILFYLQKNGGKFFGAFEAVDRAFICNDDYLGDELYKNLTFRVRIKPNEVYAEGISEKECLESLQGITHPSQMCWSLIYRKLKGNRGCTTITDYEFSKIMEKIRKKNQNKKLQAENLTFNKEIVQIQSAQLSKKYSGIQESINIENRLIEKMKRGNAFEVHLQAYIIQNLERIKCLKNKNIPIKWLGNEVACGFGMQSIDILFIQEDDKNVYISVCELKDGYISTEKYLKEQIMKYIEWIEDYIVPTYDKKVIIYPTIIGKKPKTRQCKQKVLEKIKNLDLEIQEEKYEVEKISYIEFDLNDDKIDFEKLVI